MTIQCNDNVGLTYVNTVLGRGHLNGVVNIQLGAFNFSEGEDGKIGLDPRVACRLRMDYDCAKELMDALSWCIKTIDDQASEAFSIKKLNGKSKPESTTVS